MLVQQKFRNPVEKKGILQHAGSCFEVTKVLLDTGCRPMNYCGLELVNRLDSLAHLKIIPTNHSASLGDGSTKVVVTQKVHLRLQVEQIDGTFGNPVNTEFHILPRLGERIILGLPTILRYHFDLLVHSLRNAKDELAEEEDILMAVQELLDGHIYDPWEVYDSLTPEEEGAIDALSFPDDILFYLSSTHEEAYAEYTAMLKDHVSENMATQCSKIFDLLKSELARDVFVPRSWNGLKIDPIDCILKEGMPSTLRVRARPIRRDLWIKAKAEFDRLKTYFYETDPTKCNSSIASPLVIAPKATNPFIRFCGDYVEVNKWITIPKHPIPIVIHELQKVSRYKYFLDMDMTNSFHQLPITKRFSDILSVQTPWGLVRPKFLPEGVGPASGILQTVVQKIFSDFEDWMVVIFDNFLICAHDYEDTYGKLHKVLLRCKEFGIVLKMKKSFIGMSEVSFFGYQVTNEAWEMSHERKRAIEEMSFPTDKKGMQSFLGAALFFHHHIADYSEWSAKLYEMTNKDFVWDPGQWTYDYVTHFNLFKLAVAKATKLYFPDYTLDWILRCDASDYAIGAVLFQIKILDDGTTMHQPIAFSSQKFSKEAKKGWDTYKKEAYAIYHSVHSFAYYLRGKEFLIETDHRNLQWMEKSEQPIVCRWRAYLQSFQQKVRHISGAKNRVADWLSRAPDIRHEEDATIAAIIYELGDDDFDDIMRNVHGGRKLHWGADETWRRAKQKYPEATIRMEAVREWVKHCPMCQKTRDTGCKPIEPLTLTLKPDTYRRTLGLDHTTVTPEDVNGNKCAVLTVEHFSHLPTIYAAKDYGSETLARIVFRHYCAAGTFDQLAMDPGSANCSEIVKRLNELLGVTSKYSLVERHESNGVEGSNKQFIRHLRTLVNDERIKDRWSDDTVLPLINLYLQSFPTSETGGYTPLELKYGTEDARRFDITFDQLTNGDKAIQLVAKLDENLSTIREISHRFQQEIVKERKKEK